MKLFSHKFGGHHCVNKGCYTKLIEISNKTEQKGITLHNTSERRKEEAMVACHEEK
jgi:hypothetical protein